MTIETTVRALLADDRDLARLMGGTARIYPSVAPQGAPLPYVLYQRIGYANTQSLKGPSGLGAARLQFTAWATKYSQAREIADRVRRLLDGAVDPVPPVTGELRALAILDDRDLYEPPPTGEGTGRYGALCDFRVWSEELVGV